jgi:hypothetical protein
MPARPRKTAPKKVDTPVENQENPGTSETERPSTEDSREPEVSKTAPANEVDETVVNQEHPGTSAVNRDPDPQLVTSESGVVFDISKSPAPEIVSDTDEAEKNRIRQTQAVMDARSNPEEDDDSFILDFLESGLTYAQRVWKKGEYVKVPNDRQKAWMDLSANEQKQRWGHVKFEKR